jgi:hypothetical protein
VAEVRGDVVLVRTREVEPVDGTLEARGDVDSVARGVELPSRGVARDDLASVDADASGQRRLAC